MQFESFVTQYSAELLRHATIVSADPDQAQDLVQSVLERAMARWSHIGQLDRPDLYVRRMVINEFISVRRRLRRIHFTDTVPEPDPAPDMANRIVLRTVLIEAIRALPPRERVVVPFDIGPACGTPRSPPKWAARNRRCAATTCARSANSELRSASREASTRSTAIPKRDR